MIVVDANTIIYLVRDSSFTWLAREVYAQDSDWIVPPLWKPEVLNGLLREVRTGNLVLGEAIEAASNAARILFGKVQDCEPATVLRTAEEARLTAYDACYVALARSLGVKLVTEDGRIKRQCKDVAQSLKGFLGLPEEPAAVRERRVAYRTKRRK